MKTIFVLLVALSCASPSLAQNRNTLITENNNLIKSNGVGAITGPVLNSMLFNVIEGSANQSDNNAFTGNNTHSGTETFNGPVVGVLPHVPNNAALQAIVPSAGQVEVRDGQTAAGDGGQATYSVQSGNCSTPDNGAQVQSNTSGWCWYVASSTSYDIRVWPINFTYGTDNGPSIRAAAAYSALTGTKIKFPSGQITLTSVDATGVGVIVAGPSVATTTTASASSGAPSITVASAAGIANGSNIGVQFATGYVQEVAVSGVSGNTLTISALGGNINSGANVWIYPGAGSPTATFSFEGTTANYCETGSSILKFIGTAATLPAIYVHPSVVNPNVWGMCINTAQASNWAGGPVGGLLFAIEAADANNTTNEGSINFNFSTIVGGYRGGLYEGANRGVLYSDHSVFEDGTTFGSDFEIYLNGYDAILTNFGIGDNPGGALLVNEGSQYQFSTGAIFGNGSGITVGGGHVNYINASNINIQDNVCVGLTETNATPFAGNHVAGHFFSGIVFDGNSSEGAGLCPDVKNSAAGYLNLIGPQFNGSENNSALVPNYNIQVLAGSVQLVSPTLSDAPHTVAFTNAPGSVLCAGCGSAANVTQFTVSSGANPLPSPPLGGVGTVYSVTDATSCATRGGSVTGGGSTFCAVLWNGASWQQL